MATRRNSLLLLLATVMLLPACALPLRATTDGLGNRAADERLPFGALTTTATRSALLQIHADAWSSYEFEQPLLSPGDRVVLQLEDGDEFSGSYAVGIDGGLRIPYLAPLPVLGLTVDAARDKIAAAFIREGIFTVDGPRVSLMPLLWSSVEVHVAGAVNAPGSVIINDRTHVEHRPDMKVRSGDVAPDRYLTAALRAAGGVRADADITRVVLIRNGQRSSFDLRPLLDGTRTGQPALMAGDRIEIPSTGIFQESLARPSVLTAPGFRIYASNLSIPSPSNGQSAIAGEATRLPNGARLSHALASANCVGGTHLTNAARSVLLVSRNPITTEVTSHLYRVYDVTRHADDTVNNPYMLPEDAIACFDSSVTVSRDIARTALDYLSPFQILRNIQRGSIGYE